MPKIKLLECPYPLSDSNAARIEELRDQYGNIEMNINRRKHVTKVFRTQKNEEVVDRLADIFKTQESEQQ